MTTIVKEKQYKKTHEVKDGAPCEWSKERGATHTLVIPNKVHDCGTRPAKLAKTRLYVGTSEDDAGNIVWEKWEVAQQMVWEN